METLLFRFTFLGLLFLISPISIKSQNLELSLSARGLPSMDVFNGAPDPYINIFYSAKPGDQYESHGQTEYFQDKYDVEWPEVFLFTYNSTAQQRIKIDVMDDDVDEDDYIGYVELYLKDIIGSFGYTLEREILGPNADSGFLKIVGKFTKSNSSKDIEIYKPVDKFNLNK